MTVLQVRFALVREGTSDDGLVSHLRTLLIRSGADEAVGAGRRYTGSSLDKLREVAAEGDTVDVIFVHRDADERSSAARHEEIRDAADSIDGLSPVVGVVPVQATEAWLVLDEDQIRSVVGRPAGRTPLGLPGRSAIERKAAPKDVLRHALLAASGSSGRRLRRERDLFPEYRRRLLERLDIDGPVRTLTSWQRLEQDVADVVRLMRGASPVR